MDKPNQQPQAGPLPKVQVVIDYNPNTDEVSVGGNVVSDPLSVMNVIARALLMYSNTKLAERAKVLIATASEVPPA